MTIDTNALKEHFSNMAIPTDKDFSTLIDLATTGQNAVTDNKNGTIEVNGNSITPADDSKVVHNSEIDPSAMVKRVLTDDDDVLTLDPGTYWVWGTSPKNYPTDAIHWARVVVKMLSPDGLPNGANVDNKIVEVFDENGVQMVNLYQGGGPAWSGWEVPNAGTMATKADDSKVAHLSGANNFDTVPTYGAGNKPFAINDAGATTVRPTGQAAGYQYFDTSLNKPIWYTGKNWVDSTGTTV